MQGLVTEGIKSIHLNEDKKTIRLVLKQAESDFYVDLPAANVAATLHMLIRASEAAKSGGHVVAITAAGVAADLDEAGDVLLTLEHTEGVETTFLLSLHLTVQLSGFLDIALQDRSGSSRRH